MQAVRPSRKPPRSNVKEQTIEPTLPASVSIKTEVAPELVNDTVERMPYIGSSVTFTPVLDGSTSPTHPYEWTGTLSFQWTITEPNGDTVTGSGSSFHLTPTMAGVYGVRFTVTDSAHASESATTSLTVAATAPAAAITSADTSIMSIVGDGGYEIFTMLNADVTDPGSNGSFSYQWYVNGALQAGATGSAYAFADTVANLGSDTVEVKVTDNAGNNATATTTFDVAAPTTTLNLSGGSSSSPELMIFALGNAEINASAYGGFVDEVALRNPTSISLSGHDTLIGGTGNSILQGDAGDNLLEGTSGNTTLIASAGDSLMGGNGSNVFNVDGGAGEMVESGSVLFPNSPTSNVLSFAAVTGSVATTLAPSGDAANAASTPLSLSGSFQDFIAGSGNTSLKIGAGTKNVLAFGGTGNDTMSNTGGSSVTLVAGSGNDSLSSTGPSSTVLMVGGMGSDTMSNVGGSSITMFGGTGNDTLSTYRRFVHHLGGRQRQRFTLQYRHSDASGQDRGVGWRHRQRHPVELRRLLDHHVRRHGQRHPVDHRRFLDHPGGRRPATIRSPTRVQPST